MGERGASLESRRLACVGCVGVGNFNRQACRGSYRRQAFRRRDACSPGCAACLSAVAGLRRVTRSGRVSYQRLASVVQAVVIYCVRGSYQRLAFRRRDACSPGCAAFTLPRRKLPTTGGSQAGRLRSWLRCGGDFEYNYHRLAFRRRDACALCGAKRLRRLPGCAVQPSQSQKLPPPGVSQARRLLSWLRSVHPSSEKVTVDWRFAGETPALLAALRSPFLRESYRRLAGRRRDACSSGCAVGGIR